MSKNMRIAPTKPSVSHSSPEKILRNALEKHPEIRKGLQFLLSQDNCTPVLVAMLSSKTSSQTRKSVYAAWKQICATNTLNNRLSDSREPIGIRNQRIVWLTEDTRHLVVNILGEPTKTQERPPTHVAPKKEVSTPPRTPSKNELDWKKLFSRMASKEDYCVFLYYSIFKAGKEGIQTSTAMKNAKVEQQHVDALMKAGLIEEKGQGKKKALFITPKGESLQGAIMESYTYNLHNDRGWTDPRGEIVRASI